MSPLGRQNLVLTVCQQWMGVFELGDLKNSGMNLEIPKLYLRWSEGPFTLW